MLTAAKIRLHQKYEGDADTFARAGSAAQRAELSTKEWYSIEEFILNLRLESDGLLADTFRQNLHERLVAQCASASTISLLRQAAKQRQPEAARPRRYWSWLIAAAVVTLLLVGYLLTAGK